MRNLDTNFLSITKKMLRKKCKIKNFKIYYPLYLYFKCNV